MIQKYFCYFTGRNTKLLKEYTTYCFYQFENHSYQFHNFCVVLLIIKSKQASDGINLLENNIERRSATVFLLFCINRYCKTVLKMFFIVKFLRNHFKKFLKDVIYFVDFSLKFSNLL